LQQNSSVEGVGMTHASPQKLLDLMTEQSQKVSVLKAEVRAIGSGKALDHVLLETHVGGIESLNKQVRDALAEIVVDIGAAYNSGTILDPLEVRFVSGNMTVPGVGFSGSVQNVTGELAGQSFTGSLATENAARATTAGTGSDGAPAGPTEETTAAEPETGVSPQETSEPQVA
jgi:hypothetical protein